MDSNTILGIFILIAMFILSAAVLALLGYLLKFVGFKPVSGGSSHRCSDVLTPSHKVETIGSLHEPPGWYQREYYQTHID